MSKIVLSCYAEGRDEAWEAICLNFDLSVQGHSFEEVRRKLDEAIHDYLEYVRDLPEQERPRFMNRKVPFLLRTKLAWNVFASFLGNNVSDKKERHDYTVPCVA